MWEFGMRSHAAGLWSPTGAVKQDCNKELIHCTAESIGTKIHVRCYD